MVILIVTGLPRPILWFDKWKLDTKAILAVISTRCSD
jgi:hypothetical protein